jgi:acyl-CoA reductase-like NAD-dependent aldehyde dehydrogenase
LLARRPLIDVPADADVHGEEAFGPIRALDRACDIDDAMASANRPS